MKRGDMHSSSVTGACAGHLSGMQGMCMALLMCPIWTAGRAVCGRTLASEVRCSRWWRAKSISGT